MNERQIQIFLYIYNKKDWITSEELANYFNLNKKTIQQEIRQISNTLSQGLIINKNKHKGYRIEKISAETKNKLNEEIYLSEGKNSLTYIGSKIIIMLLFYKDYVTMQELADSLFMSKTAISLDIDNIRRWIKRYKGLMLEVNRQKGIKIHGDELQKRVYCSIHVTLDIFNDIPFLESMKTEYMIYYNVIEKILVNSFLENDYIITGEDLKKSARFITLSLIRSELGYTRNLPDKQVRQTHLVSNVISKIENNINYTFNDSELQDIDLFLSQSNTVTPSDDLKTSKETKSKIRQFLKDVSDLIDLDIDFQPIDICLLEDYINRKVSREKYGNIVINHYNEEIIIEYPLEAYLVQRLISNYFPIEYVKELTYFSLFLTGIIDQNKKQSILLVCDQSVSTITYLKNYLLNHFSYAVKDIRVVPTYQYYDVQNKREDYDIFLTTNHKILLNEPDFFLIAPVLDKNEKENIEFFIKNKLLDLKKNNRDNLLNNYYSVKNIDSTEEKYQNLLLSLVEDRTSEDVLQTFSKTNLFKCSIKRNGKSEITVYNLSKPLFFEYKKISRIIDVKYSKEDDLNILPFFDAVSDILTSYK